MLAQGMSFYIHGLPKLKYLSGQGVSSVVELKDGVSLKWAMGETRVSPPTPETLYCSTHTRTIS